MAYLFFVSLFWAFSFGMIKTSLAGIDPNVVAAARLGLSLLVFLPFFRPRQVSRSAAIRLVFCGAVQYGGMYIAYLHAFRYLQAYEVAFFTLFTPLYVTLLNDLAERKLNRIALSAVILAVAGSWIARGGNTSVGLSTGFLMVQVSNLCFAFGQLEYRRILDCKVSKNTLNEAHIFALPYLGGFGVSALAVLFFADRSTLALTLPQGLTLIYLGVVASGLCFFLWNVGARRTNAGTLAIFNNFKVPLAIAVSLAFFGEQADIPRLMLGGGLLVLALLWNEWRGMHGKIEKVFHIISAKGSNGIS
jgi:drug/metabolite transporter (DMT)-like permease